MKRDEDRTKLQQTNEWRGNLFAARCFFTALAGRAARIAGMTVLLGVAAMLQIGALRVGFRLFVVFMCCFLGLALSFVAVVFAAVGTVWHKR